MSNHSEDAASLTERARNVLPGGITRSTVYVPPHPPYAATGSGALVQDVSGHVLVDCNNNYTSLIHGHSSRQEIVEAAVSATRSGTAFGLPTRHEVDFAEYLAARTGVEKWRFCNSGTEAVLMMLRAARAFTQRDTIIRFAGSYHGTGDEVVDPKAAGVPKWVEESVLVVPQGDLDALKDALREHGNRVAAVLIDLMPNRAGLNPATREFVQELRALTRRYGVLLAIDEVISFRLSWGGFHQHYGVEPDLISTGKIIGGGFPVGAVGGKAGFLREFDPARAGAVMWGGTFSANPVTMVAGLTALRLFDQDAISALNAKGESMRGDLEAAGVRVNGFGSLLRIMTSDTKALWWSLYERGVLAGSNGLLALSTAMNDKHLSHVIEAVAEGARNVGDTGTPEQ
ncbi:glutamate-1-semialdehyde 2,1-aminomutase [Saccharopolyspora spinosa]|uniref:Glutamate-1-semialdehyde 2,1-aminomutase n=1 Tax=Saccharopolyspora spinosa TaxID=60894 RepID=A0A2N3XZT4_SACSN|nr:glutamate-1-semialdehyde 2,1-aminomutase [Saccharopolyspora spinosa]